MTTRLAPEALAIPASHLDLLTRPICGVLTTMDAGGQPQSMPGASPWTPSNPEPDSIGGQSATATG